jgi:hypothetical protein
MTDFWLGFFAGVGMTIIVWVIAIAIVMDRVRKMRPWDDPPAERRSDE